MISKTYGIFFEDLSKNNNKEWFHANKKRYELEVKYPFMKLGQEVLQTLRIWDSRIPQDIKNSLFRINRDIRFSKDKSPYHVIMKAGFAPNGRKSGLPGYYLGIDAENVHVGGGLFMINTPELKRIRHYISLNSEEFLRLVKNRDFKSAFGQLKGDTSKRLDKDLQESAQRNEYLYHKQFYAFAEFPLSGFYGSNGIGAEILEHFEAIRPLNTYLEQALYH